MSTLTMVAVIGFAAMKLQDLARYAKARDWNGVVGTAGGWAVGIALAFLVANAKAFAGWQPVDGLPAVGQMDGWSLVMLGAGIMSLVQVVAVDYRKALDNSQSSRVPQLVNDPPPDDPTY